MIEEHQGAQDPQLVPRTCKGAVVIRALRYRKGQAAALALLAALVTACAVFAPLYDRAMQQALVDVKLAQAVPQDSGLTIQVRRPSDPIYASAPIPSPTDLVELVSAPLRRDFRAPVLGWTATATENPDVRRRTGGQVAWRTDVCDHVRIVSGRCPSKAGEILTSTEDAQVLGLSPGRTVSVATQPLVADSTQTRDLVIVGTYAEIAGDDWFGQPLTGWSGQLSETTQPYLRHEIWLATEETFADTAAERLPDLASSAAFALAAGRVDVDEIRRLTALDRLPAADELAQNRGVVQVQTGLPEIARQVADQVDDSRVLVPLILLPLGILCLVVLWLVLATVTDLRRSEIAVARLRGQGVRGARRLLAAELLPAVLLGVVPGAAAAVGGAWLAARALPGDDTVELRAPVWVALTGVVVVLLVTTLIAGARAARTPVDALLRRSATVRRGWRLGVVDAVALTGCAVVAAAFVTGSLSGPAAYAAPALFALLVGLVLGHLLTPLAAMAGRRLLRRRATGAALGLLDAARSPSLRSTLTVLTVATALTVFAVDAVVVAADNRDSAARQEAGAPVVIDVDTTDLDSLEAALDDVDDRRVTPVVRVVPPGVDAVTTLAVHPAEFARVALAPTGLLPRGWTDAVSRTEVEPVELTGRRLAMTVAGDLTALAETGTPASPIVGLDLVSGARVLHTDLGPVTTSGGTLAASVPCERTCQLGAITVSGTVGGTMDGRFSLTRIAVDGRPVDLGPAEDWTGYDDPHSGSAAVAGDGPLAVTIATAGPASVSLTHRWFGTPAALATTSTPATDGALTISGIDGKARTVGLVGRAARIPGAPARVVLADLDVLRRGAVVSGDARVSVWLGAANAGLIRQVEDAMSDHDITVTGVTTLADVRRGLDQSIPTWSVQLGVLTGLASLGVAIVMLLVVAVGGWRVRARDLASLWVGGVPHRTVGRLAVAAQLPTIAVAVLAGTGAGLVGAAVSMSLIPLFAEPPEVSTVDLGTPWLAIAGVAVACVVLLGLVGALAGRAVFRRADLARLREAA